MSCDGEVPAGGKVVMLLEQPGPHALARRDLAVLLAFLNTQVRSTGPAARRSVAPEPVLPQTPLAWGRKRGGGSSCCCCCGGEARLAGAGPVRSSRLGSSSGQIIVRRRSMN